MLVLGPAQAQEKVVKIYNWSDYIDPQVLKDFTAKTGIEVVYDVFDSNEVLETKLLGRQHRLRPRGPDQQFPRRGRSRPASSLPLDHAKMPDWSNLDSGPDGPGRRSTTRQPARLHLHVGHHRPGLQCGQGQGAPAGGACQFVGAAVRSGQRRKLADCGIMVLDSPTDVIPMRLALSGRGSGQQEPGGDREGHGAAGEDPALRPQVPQLGEPERPGQWRHLPVA